MIFASMRTKVKKKAECAGEGYFIWVCITWLCVHVWQGGQCA